MDYEIVWVRGHIEVYDWAGRFCFSADNEREALEELGLTTMDFAGLIKSPRRDGEGKETGAYDYGLRYTEFIPINTWEIQKLKTRVTELEQRLAALEGGNHGETGE